MSSDTHLVRQSEKELLNPQKLNSRLQIWGLLSAVMKISEQVDNLCFCTKIYGQCTALGCQHDSQQWHILKDLSLLNVKNCLVTQCSPSCTDAANLTENMDALKHIYCNYNWNIFGDLKVVVLLVGLCSSDMPSTIVSFCQQDRCAKESCSIKKNWPLDKWLKGMAQKSLVNTRKIVLPLLLTKYRINEKFLEQSMRNFQKVMNKVKYVDTCEQHFL